MGQLEDRARRVLAHEQRTNHADIAVRPGGLTAFMGNWAREARAQGYPLADRLLAMFQDYATLDPMQRAAQVRAALALLQTAPVDAPAPRHSSPTGPATPAHAAQSTDSPTVRPSVSGHTSIANRPMQSQTTSPPPTMMPQSSASGGAYAPPGIDHGGRKLNGHTTTTGQDEEKVSTTNPTVPTLSRATQTKAPPVGEYLLDQPITVVPGVGPAMAEKLARLEIRTVRDLLYDLPRDHHDYSALAKIGELPFDEIVTVLGVIWEVENVRNPKSKMTRTIARISDETGDIRVVWFNQPYLQKQLPRGAQIVVTGIKQRFGNAVQLSAKSHELPEQGDLINTGRLVPVYGLTEGLSAKALRRATKWVTDRCASLVADYLPVAVRAGTRLMPLPEALAQYHYPENNAALAAARHRLAFDELFIIQLGMLARRANWRVGPPAPPIHIARDRLLLDAPPTPDSTPPSTLPAPLPAIGLWGAVLAEAQCFEAELPFRFTDAQRRVINEVLDDLACPAPMCRLVQGDVGSGKTAVAATAMLAAALSGYQAAIMAPTEILAEQHARSLQRMLAPFGIEVAVLLGSQRARQRADQLAAIAAGTARVVVGTHALIQENVTFARLGLAVIDEQHRFGVEQREALRQKGHGVTPHLLVMTATPIPRTLALAVYGDLDLSVIDQMPSGRRPIITRWRAGSRRAEAYELMAREVAAGRHGYIICPLSEESETLEARAAVAEYERLRNEVFPDLRMGLVHGALKPAEKDLAMRRFRDGEIDILVATAVVEVGVDVPNASMMIIEDADRFGLAQLHQFRGRVGRGDDQSYCYVLSQEAGAQARERLNVIEATTDGFALAEADLRLRGPGEFFGTRQSGLPELRVADITDGPLVEEARQAANQIWERDPFLRSLEHAPLRERVAIFWQSYMAQ